MRAMPRCAEAVAVTTAPFCTVVASAGPSSRTAGGVVIGVASPKIALMRM
jgi:hypothetical protein